MSQHPLTGEELTEAALAIQHRMLASCLFGGTVIPVKVFGDDLCCEHGPDVDCESKGIGLCDRFSAHAPGGSDCNRAGQWLLRPSDAAMDSPEVRAALAAVLEE